MIRFAYHIKYQKFLAMGLNYLTEKKSRMDIKEKLFRPILTTKGRKTGKQHSVMLRAVSYNGKI